MVFYCIRHAQIGTCQWFINYASTPESKHLGLVIQSNVNCVVFFYSRIRAGLNTTAGSSCPLLFSLQHTPNFFSAPPPLLSCLTCSSSRPVAEQLVSEGGVGAWGWRWCWCPVDTLRCKMAGGGFPLLPSPPSDVRSTLEERALFILRPSIHVQFRLYRLPSSLCSIFCLYRHTLLSFLLTTITTKPYVQVKHLHTDACDVETILKN